jgi:hypothetical protein
MITGALMLVTALAWFAGFGGPGRVDAQQAKRQREDSSSRTRVEFRQAEAVYNRMAELIGEWERKGWETYQILPVFPTNPGLGRPMTVAIVFRRTVK